MPDLYQRRFVELTLQLTEVQATEGTDPEDFPYNVNGPMFLAWKMSARDLIAKACGGPKSEYYQTFTANEQDHRLYSAQVLKKLAAVFAAGKKDYEDGYMQSADSLVQAEVFASELDQARELVSKGYVQAAAVISGCVLETGLQAMCKKHGLPLGKIEAMNVALVKQGLYNVLKQKQITAHADLRNKAAHSNRDAFNKADVESMIADVERILAELLN